MEGGKRLWSQVAVNWTWHTGLRGLIITEATLAFCNLWIRRALCFSCFSLISCIKLWLLLLCSWLPGAQGPWWPCDYVPTVLREPDCERLWWQHAQSVVSSHRQGKVSALLDSLGNEPLVELWHSKNGTMPSDRAAGWPLVPLGQESDDVLDNHLSCLFLHRNSSSSKKPPWCEIAMLLMLPLAYILVLLAILLFLWSHLWHGF